MKSSFKSVLTLVLISALPARSPACDSCTLFVADDLPQRALTVSIAEQFTRFGTVWSGGSRLGNPVDQYLNSSITQATIAYAPRPAWSAQLTLPYIARSYLRPEHALLDRGRVSGIGDTTLAARYVAFARTSDTRTVSFALLGGVEFGTGNADHLGDELGHHFHHHAGFPDSGIHGHDLALGSGSTDYLLGADGTWRQGRNFARAALQYKLRRPGKFGYRLADETAWEAGIGHDFTLAERFTVSAQALFSAEHKGLDLLAGEAQVDTGFSARYLGGRVSATLAPRCAVDASLELPVWIRTTETMVVPDYRVRASVSWRL